MEYFNLHGISWAVDGRIEDILHLIGPAMQDLQKLKDRCPGLDIMRYERPGAWTIVSMHGIDTIRLSSGAVSGQKKVRKEIREERTSQYVPAFHAFDENGVWLGIVICLAGKWGPPYQFVQCKEDEIYPFEHGLWNTSSSASRPDDYKERYVADIYTKPEIKTSIFEIPADHEYIGSTAEMTASVGSSTAYSDIHMALCEYEEPGGRECPWATKEDNSYSNVEHRLIVIDNWDAYETDYAKYKSAAPYMKSWSERYTHDATSNVVDHGDGEGWVAPSGGWWHNEAIVWSGIEPVSMGASANDITSEESLYFYGLKVVSARENDSAPVLGPITTAGSDTSSFSDYVSVFGKEYQLKSLGAINTSWDFPSVPVLQYYNIDLCLSGVKPRIYFMQSDNPASRWALASLKRMLDQSRATDHFEYLCFHGETEQFNDESAFFTPLASNPALHEIPITVNDHQVYGNGEFSLIRIDAIEIKEREVF
jgi:hypothetical protein